MLGFRRSRRQCCAEFLEQFRAEHDIAVLAALAALDVNHHALAVDVADFQARQFGASHSGGVESHQQSAMEGSASRIDESRDFFLTEDRRQANASSSGRESRPCSRPS